MELLIIHFSPTPGYFLPLSPRKFHQHPLPKHPQLIFLLLTKKCTIFDANTVFLLITLLHVSMCKHNYQGLSLYATVTKSIKMKFTVIGRYHNTIKRSAHHTALYSKLGTI